MGHFRSGLRLNRRDPPALLKLTHMNFKVQFIVSITSMLILCIAVLQIFPAVVEIYNILPDVRVAKRPIQDVFHLCFLFWAPFSQAVLSLIIIFVCTCSGVAPRFVTRGGVASKSASRGTEVVPTTSVLPDRPTPPGHP